MTKSEPAFAEDRYGAASDERMPESLMLKVRRVIFAIIDNR
jgi:hypothetical protein